MQTFLPYKSFEKSAKCLDYRRLGKQRVEAWQIYITITENRKAWANHPIVKMWRNYPAMLLIYAMTMCEEWRSRGYNDILLERFWCEFRKMFPSNIAPYIEKPYWLGNRKFHASHRSNLLRKDKKYYSKFKWKEKNNLPYVWLT